MELHGSDLEAAEAQNARDAPAPPNERADETSQAGASARSSQRPFQDIPLWIWRSFLGSWLGLFVTFVLTFGVNGGVHFVFGVMAVFAAVYFLTPWMLLRMTRRRAPPTMQPTARRIDLLHGDCGEGEAAFQIVLLPLVLTAGLIIIALFVPR